MNTEQNKVNRINANAALARANDALELTSANLAGVSLAGDIIAGDKDTSVYYDAPFVVARAHTVIRTINDKASKSACLLVIRDFAHIAQSQVNKAIKHGRKIEKLDTDAITFALQKNRDKLSAKGMSYAEADAEYITRQNKLAERKAARAAKVAELATIQPE